MSGIAFETIHYAIECVGSGERALALDTLDAEDNGLTLEQQKAARGIIESAGEVREGRSLSRFGNRLLSVLQPATLKFLENPVLIAAVMRYLHSSYIKDCRPTVGVLGIQTSYAAIHQHHMRQKLKEMTALGFEEIGPYMHKLRHLETGKSLNMGEFLALCPNFEQLDTPGDATTLAITQMFDSQVLDQIAEGLKKGKNPKFCKFVSYLTLYVREIRKLKAFPQLTQFTFAHDPTLGQIQAVLELPDLKSLEFRETTTILDNLDLLRSPKLDTVKLTLRSEQPFFTEDQLQILSSVPVKGLKFSYSEKITDFDLIKLFRFRSLETVEMFFCKRITKKGVIQFLQLMSKMPATQIKKVTIHPAEFYGNGMSKSEVQEIQRIFPNIVIIGKR